MKIFEINKSYPKSKKINQDKIDKFLSTKCPIAYNSSFKIYRGMPARFNIGLGDSRKTKRESANTENYYTILLDEVITSWKRYPKRSLSYICTTDRQKASEYGVAFQVYPIGDPYIGICPRDDLWNSFKNSNLFFFNSFLKKCAVRESLYLDETLPSLLHLIGNLDMSWKSDQHIKNYVADFFKINANEFDSFTKVLYWYLDPKRNNFKLAKLSKLKESDENQEVWFTGPAYFVQI